MVNRFGRRDPVSSHAGLAQTAVAFQYLFSKFVPGRTVTAFVPATAAGGAPPAGELLVLFAVARAIAGQSRASGAPAWRRRSFHYVAVITRSAALSAAVQKALIPLSTMVISNVYVSLATRVNVSCLS